MNKKKKPGQGLSLKVITEKVIFIFLTQIVTEIVGGNKMDILKVVSQGLVTALILYVFRHTGYERFGVFGHLKNTFF